MLLDLFPNLYSISLVYLFILYAYASRAIVIYFIMYLLIMFFWRAIVS